MMSEVREYCREWPMDAIHRCDQPAVAIIWGKLYPPEALGPRCEEHIAKHHGGRGLPELLRLGYALFDLRNLVRK